MLFRRTLLFAGLALPAAGHAAAVIGQPAPALRLATLDGGRFDLAALRGQVVIVNAWATWCAPCREEMPALDAYYRSRRAQGLALFGLSADRPRDLDAARRVMAPFGYPAGLLRGAEENGFGTPSVLPTTWLVDRSGVVRAQWLPASNPITAESLPRMVDPLLRAR